MEIIGTLKKLNDSIDCLKFLIPNNLYLSYNDNPYSATSIRPPPISHKLENKFNGLRKTLYDNLEKNTQKPMRTNIPINTKYLTLKKNPVSHHNNQHCDECFCVPDRSKSKTKTSDNKFSTSSAQKKIKQINIDNGMSVKPTKIKTPTLVNKNFSTFSTNSKIYQSNTIFTSSRFCSKNVDLVRLKLNGKIPQLNQELNSSVNEKSHLKFDQRKILNQIYYI